MKNKIILALLLILIIYLNIQISTKINELVELEKDNNLLEEKVSFIQEHEDDLTTIKELKQEILGEENKLKEYTTQITELTKILVEMQDELDKRSDD